MKDVFKAIPHNQFYIGENALNIVSVMFSHSIKRVAIALSALFPEIRAKGRE